MNDLIVRFTNADAAYDRSSVRVPRLFDEKSVQALYESESVNEDIEAVCPDAVMQGNMRAGRKKTDIIAML